MEEQRARQEDEARKAVAASVSETTGTVQKMEGMYCCYGDRHRHCHRCVYLPPYLHRHRGASDGVAGQCITFLAFRLTIRHWRGGVAEQFASMHVITTVSLVAPSHQGKTAR